MGKFDKIEVDFSNLKKMLGEIFDERIEKLNLSEADAKKIRSAFQEDDISAEYLTAKKEEELNSRVEKAVEDVRMKLKKFASESRKDFGSILKDKLIETFKESKYHNMDADSLEDIEAKDDFINLIDEEIDSACYSIVEEIKEIIFKSVYDEQETLKGNLEKDLEIKFEELIASSKNEILSAFDKDLERKRAEKIIDKAFNNMKFTYYDTIFKSIADDIQLEKDELSEANDELDNIEEIIDEKIRPALIKELKKAFK